MAENLVSADITTQNETDFKAAIDTAAAIFSFLITLSEEDRKRKRKMGAKSTGYVDAVYTGVNAHPGVLPSSYSVAEFTKDKIAEDKMPGLIAYVMTKLIEPMGDTELQIRHELIEQADHGHELLKTAGKKGNEAVKATLDLIAATLPDTGKRYPVALMDVGINSSVTVNNTVPGTRLIVVGDSILEVGVGPDLADKVKGPAQRITPGSSMKIPEGWSQIFVKNLSTDTPGQFTVKIKNA